MILSTIYKRIQLYIMPIAHAGMSNINNSELSHRLQRLLTPKKKIELIIYNTLEYLILLSLPVGVIPQLFHQLQV